MVIRSKEITVPTNVEGSVVVAPKYPASVTITRNASNFITGIDDGTRVWAIVRDSNNYITSYTIT